MAKHILTYNLERVTTIPYGSRLQADGSRSGSGLNRDRDIVCSIWKHIAGYNPAESSCVGSGTHRKHYGRKIKKYHYLPLLDDRNVNDQGIDATGAYISNGNLYGSSKDIGYISGKIPTLTEHGGRSLAA